jgi:hypothetical protein
MPSLPEWWHFAMVASFGLRAHLYRAMEVRAETFLTLTLERRSFSPIGGEFQRDCLFLGEVT